MPCIEIEDPSALLFPDAVRFRCDNGWQLIENSGRKCVEMNLSEQQKRQLQLIQLEEDSLLLSANQLQSYAIERNAIVEAIQLPSTDVTLAEQQAKQELARLHVTATNVTSTVGGILSIVVGLLVYQFGVGALESLGGVVKNGLESAKNVTLMAANTAVTNASFTLHNDKWLNYMMLTQIVGSIVELSTAKVGPFAKLHTIAIVLKDVLLNSVLRLDEVARVADVKSDVRKLLKEPAGILASLGGRLYRACSTLMKTAAWVTRVSSGYLVGLGANWVMKFIPISSVFSEIYQTVFVLGTSSLPPWAANALFWMAIVFLLQLTCIMLRYLGLWLVCRSKPVGSQERAECQAQLAAISPLNALRELFQRFQLMVAHFRQMYEILERPTRNSPWHLWIQQLALCVTSGLNLLTGMLKPISLFEAEKPLEAPTTVGGQVRLISDATEKLLPVLPEGSRAVFEFLVYVYQMLNLDFWLGWASLAYSSKPVSLALQETIAKTPAVPWQSMASYLGGFLAAPPSMDYSDFRM